MHNLAQYIEHTLLKQDAVQKDFDKLFAEAKEYNFRGVCINPAYVKDASVKLEGTNIKIVTVIGFPLGANTSETKAFEAKQAVSDGADEIDMVINVTAVKDNRWEDVKNDITMVRKACPGNVLKVILETDLLTKDEIKKACEICVEAKADFVKTSTGFVKNGTGAKVEDVKLMHDIVSPYGLRVKASGGIRDKRTALTMIEAGATSLGTSAGVSIMNG